MLDAYVEPVNVDRAMAGARLGMSDALDGDSAYLDAEEFRLYQAPAPEAEAEVGLVLTRRFAFVMVVAARPGSPAEKAGLRPGDLVKTIDERAHPADGGGGGGAAAARGARLLGEARHPARGGRPVRGRRWCASGSCPRSPQGRMLEGGVGYVKVTDFTPATAEDVRTQVEALKRGGAARLVLDLRDAAWGAPADGVKVAELFLEGGPVAKLVGRRAEEQLLQADAREDRVERAARRARRQRNGGAGRDRGRGAPRRRAAPSSWASGPSVARGSPGRCRCPRAASC